MSDTAAPERPARPEKVAIVEEVQARLDASDAVILTEYRGLDVAAMAELRSALRDAGGEYKIYKNNLVKLAARNLELDIEDLLTGPTALAFVMSGDGEGPADPVLVAKALKTFAADHPELVVKGGVMGEHLLSADDAKALANIAPRDELLGKFAGLLAAPMQQFAGLLAALPRDFAYALQALIAEGGASTAPEPDAAAPSEDTQEDEGGSEASADETPTEES